MRLADAEAKLKDRAARIDTTAFLTKINDYNRGGLPAASFTDGRGSAETPDVVAEHSMPEGWKPLDGQPDNTVVGPTDNTDQRARVDLAEYRHLLSRAADLLDDAHRIQTRWCNPAPAVGEPHLTKPPPGAGPCGNTWCDHTCTGKGNDRLRKSKRKGDDPTKTPIARCHACDVYWLRNGTERPRALCVAV